MILRCNVYGSWHPCMGRILVTCNSR
jgi:hypothetical protein